jgi:hypothetical protein
LRMVSSSRRCNPSRSSFSFFSSCRRRSS